MLNKYSLETIIEFLISTQDNLLSDIECYRYAGIGSRRTPENTLSIITKLASLLCAKRFILRSGGAIGADSAFEKGCDAILSTRKEIYKTKTVTTEALDLTKELLGNEHWNNCDEPARKLHARNIQLILGLDLKIPVKFIICWTDQINRGGTRTSVLIAEKHNIPVFNLYDQETLMEAKALSLKNK